MNQKDYEQLQTKLSPKTPIGLNLLKAFLVGGIICVIGQAISFSIL